MQILPLKVSGNGVKLKQLCKIQISHLHPYKFLFFLISSFSNPKEKLETALACRKDLQASLISLECAQFSLPHVEIKNISNRQILAVKHCNTYMVTDVANLARYEHTSKVFIAYESNVSKASAWLYDTFSKTLRNDFDKAEETVRNLAKTLRDHREEIFTAARR